MAKLHELLAVEADLLSTANALLEEASVTFTKKVEHFRGQTRSITFFDASREKENLTETKAMVTTVDDKLSYALGQVVPYFDALLQKEATNQQATADLTVDGEVLAKDVPATFLLGMETRLKKLHEVLIGIPTLDPNVVWTLDPASGAGVYRSDPAVSFRTEKQVRHKVLYDATDKHPAQIEKWNEDVPVARIETLHRAGLWTPAHKSEVLGRLDKLMREVKKARQRANTVEVDDRHIGAQLVAYILGD